MIQTATVIQKSRAALDHAQLSLKRLPGAISGPSIQYAHFKHTFLLVHVQKM